MRHFLILLATLPALPIAADHCILLPSEIVRSSASALGGSPPQSTDGASNINKMTGIVRDLHFLPHDPTCANIRDYGGDKTGIIPSDTAFDSAVAASQSGHICVYLPAGTYRFNKAHSVSLSSAVNSASVTIQGDGPDVTNLSFSRGTDGLAIWLNDASHSFHARSLSVLGGTYSTHTTGIAVVQNAIVPNPAYTAQSDISNVSVRGTDGYAKKNGFGTGISLLKSSNINLINDYIIGTGSATAKCIIVAGTSENIAVVFNLIGTAVNSCATGLYYGPNMQGVSITSSNMTGNLIGVYSPPNAPNLGQLAITSSQFANVDFDINLQTDPGGMTISDNYFLANANSSPGNARINISSSKNTSITGNVFQGVMGINAIVIQASTPLWSMFIGGNIFNQFTTAIWLQNDSQNVTVGINSFKGNKKDVLNSGRNNIIPIVLCSGNPTSSFTVVNGIITHC